MEKKLADRLTGFWEENIKKDVPVNDLVIRRIIKHAVDHWELHEGAMETEETLDSLTFTYLPIEKDRDKPRIQLHIKNTNSPFLVVQNISYDAESGNYFGSGGSLQIR